MGHSFGDIYTGFVVSHEAAPSCHTSKGSFNDPSPRQDLEACLFVGTPANLDDKVQEGSLVHELPPVVGAVGEEVLQPWSVLADSIEEHLRSCGIGDIGGGHVDHQQPTIGIDSNMALAANDLLSRIVAARFGARRFDRLAVDKARAGARFATHPFAIRHQGDFMDGTKQKQPQVRAGSRRSAIAAASLSASASLRSASASSMTSLSELIRPPPNAAVIFLLPTTGNENGSIVS